LTRIGNSVGVILPKEVLVRLKLEKGDTVFVTDAVNGATLTPYDPALAEQLGAGRECSGLAKRPPHRLGPTACTVCGPRVMRRAWRTNKFALRPMLVH
jgi:putative addiction module antidote